MAKNALKNRQQFEDGQIVLYQLDGRPKKKWLCRIKNPSGPGYIVRGTGTADIFKAHAVALNLLRDLSSGREDGRPINRRKLSELFVEFEKHFPAEARSPKRADRVCEFLRTYAQPYFSKKRVSELTSEEVAKFFDWRRQHFVRKPPSAATIVSEIGKMKVFTDWCHVRGHIPTAVRYKKPPVKLNRRPDFSIEEWKKLVQHLQQSRRDKSQTADTLRNRNMLFTFVMILRHTGIRVGEARQLRWSDVRSFHDQENKIQLSLIVRGKTGIREAISRSRTMIDLLNDLKKIRAKEIGVVPKDDEFIFCHRDGSAIHSFKKGFNSVLKKAGLEYSSHEERRTIYSLRHTYATVHLHEGVGPYALAQNMGTSVRMIEQYYGHTTNRLLVPELQRGRRKSD